MTVKQFFKSAAFKCIIVLFAILILCGGALTVAYGFLEVSEGEKLQRAVGKIYSGEEVLVYGAGGVLIDADNKDPQSLVEEDVIYDDAEILAAYIVKFEGKDDVNYLVKSKGLHGYSEGSVTCWVAISVDETSGTIVKIEKVQVGESSGQTFMNKITGDMMDAYTAASFEGEAPVFDKSVKIDGERPYVSTGASFSSAAINNSVNGAVQYVTGRLGGEQ